MTGPLDPVYPKHNNLVAMAPEGGLTVPPLKDIMAEFGKNNPEDITTAMLQSQIIETLYARVKELEDDKSVLRAQLLRIESCKGTRIRLNREITLYIIEEIWGDDKYRAAYQKDGLTTNPPDKFKHLFGTTGEAIIDTSMLAKIILYFEHGENDAD